MKVKRTISAIMVLLLVAVASGQTVPGADGLSGIEWRGRCPA